MHRWSPLINVLLFVSVQISFAQVESSRRINAIQFTGSTTFDGATLENQLHITRVDKRVTSSIIEWDIETNLKPFLRENGFVQCQVTFEEIPLTAEDMNLHVMISEGSQYRLASLNFTGIKTFKKEAIAAQFDMHPGDVVNFKKIREGLDTVRRMYEAYGFINWSYIPEQTFDEQNKTMTLSFSIDQGYQYFVAYVAFVGCRDQAQEEHLKTQTIAQPGHNYDPVKLDFDTRRLKQMLGVDVKASIEILPEKALVGIVYSLDCVTTK
jgi:outer membrane protein assembly factor BamA